LFRLVQTIGCANDPNGVPTCNLGDIPSGGSAQFTIEVLVDAGTAGTILNQAAVTSDTIDPNTSNNSTTGDTIVNPLLGSIGDRVWSDEDGDRIQDGG
jgi:hypothetical protein